jgi:hypothetical protein
VGGIQNLTAQRSAGLDRSQCHAGDCFCSTPQPLPGTVLASVTGVGEALAGFAGANSAG